MTYTATFTETLNTYTVTWKNEDGTVLETDENVPYGTTPTYNGETPTKAADAQYTYTFTGWSPEIVAVTGDATYTAQFTGTIRSYTINWIDGDGNTLKTEQLDYGTTPSYTGATPTKTATAQYSYIFTGWSPEIASVSGNASYVAQFDSTVNRYSVTASATNGSVAFSENVTDGKADYGASVTATATPENEDYVFDAWLDSNGSAVSTANPYTFTVTGDMALTARFKLSFEPVAKIGEQYFRTLDAAVAASQSGDTIVILDNITQGTDVTIPSGVTLLLPYAEGGETVNAASDAHPYANENIVGHTAAITPVGQDVSYLLTLTDGAKLIVSDGAKLVVGGTLSGGHPIAGGTYGPHSEITMTNGASIEVASGAVLSNCGYITGGTVNAFGTVYEPFVATDFHGGTVTVQRVAAHNSPFNSYTVLNIQSDLVVNSGAKLNGYFTIYAGSEQQRTTISAVGEDGMLRLGSGATATIRYDAAYPVTVANTPIGKTTFDFDGDVSFNSFGLEYSGVTFNTADLTFTIPYNIAMNQNSGCFTVDSDAVVLPGSVITVAEGASAVVKAGKALYVADSFAPNNEGGQETYPASLAGERGSLFIDGELTIEDGATFAGVVQTHGTGKVIAGENANLGNPLKPNDVSFSVGGGQNVTTYPLQARMAMLSEDGNALIPMDDTQDSGQATTYYAISNATVADENRTEVTGTWGYDLDVTFDKNDKDATGVTVASGRIGQTFTYPESKFRLSGRTFSGWNTKKDGTGTMYQPGEEIDLTVDTVIARYAQWTTNSYKLTYTVDGETVEEQMVPYGMKLTAIDEPTKVGYTFSGWSEIPATMPDQDVTITGYFTVNTHTVTYTVDGEVFGDVDTVAYGTPLTLRDEPTKEGYIFSGWSETPETMPDEDIEVTGEFTVNAYDLIFTVDGEEYERVKVNYGEELTAIAEPTREGHTFSGWSQLPETMPAHEVTITGSFTVNSYTVTYFVDGETYGLVDTVAYGTELTLRDEPVKEGYTFSGWSEIPETMPAENLEVTGTFSINSYKLTYTVDGETVEEQTVPYGTKLTAIDEPTKVGYTFSGWSEIPETMPADDLVIEGTFAINHYTVKFFDEDGTTLLATADAEYNTLPVFTGDTPTKAATDQYTYTFSGWSPEVVPATEDTAYIAVYSETVNKYTVKFVNEDGTELQSSEVAYGDMPAYTGDTPTKAATAQYTYTFSGWTPEIEPVTGIATYTATYTSTVNKYTVTFYDEDGKTVLDQQQVAYGVVPVYAGETPTKAADAQYTYAFGEWDHPITKVEGDQSYTATYTPTTNEYTVTFVNDDGTELQSGSVPYGELPVYTGETPTKAADAQYTYTFDKWSPEITTVTGAATYTATYSATVNEYTITFVNEDGTVLQRGSVAYGDTPEYTGATPTKAADVQYTYTFDTWSPTITAVTGDTTYTATFASTVNTYAVVWKNFDGTILETDNAVEYGETPTYDGDTPVKATADNEGGAYTFRGWDPEISDVTGAVEYTAQFTFTGWRTDETGKQYFKADEMQKEWLELEGEDGTLKYYLDPDTGYAAVGMVQIDENDPGHAFDENGIWQESSGLFTDSKTNDIYLLENGILTDVPGLYRDPVKEEYYFFENGMAVKSRTVEVTEANANGLELPEGDYAFNANGFINHEDVTMDGIRTVNGTKYFYLDGIRVFKGMFREGDDYYYATRTGKLVTDKTYWCTRNNGLKEEGPYTFDADGKMVIEQAKNGIYSEDGSLFYYENGSRTYAGLIEINGNYYYVRTNGEVVHGRTYWITKTNGEMDEGSYTFDDDGKMVIVEAKNGIYAEDGSLFYYKDGSRYYAGLIEIDGAYYYVRTNGEVVHGRSSWITKTNDILPEKAYTFADDGKLIPEEEQPAKNGIVAGDDTLFYYVDGVRTYAGLIEIDGAYYYVKTDGEVVHGRSYWITKTNGLMDEGAYTFDDDGRMVDPPVPPHPTIVD